MTKKQKIHLAFPFLRHMAASPPHLAVLPRYPSPPEAQSPLSLSCCHIHTPITNTSLIICCAKRSRLSKGWRHHKLPPQDKQLLGHFRLNTLHKCLAPLSTAVEYIATSSATLAPSHASFTLINPKSKDYSVWDLFEGATTALRSASVLCA